MFRIGIILGSTRPSRRGDQIARWVERTAQRNAGGLRLSLEIVDLRDHPDVIAREEAAPAIFGDYADQHTRDWAEVIDAYDAFVFVVPEYNHGIPGPLKSAIDTLFGEWNDKAAGFVSYGINGGVRASEQLRLVLAEVKVATVRAQVALGMFSDFEISDPLERGTLRPAGHQEQALTTMVDEVVAWGSALRSMRLDEPVAV